MATAHGLRQRPTSRAVQQATAQCGAARTPLPTTAPSYPLQVNGNVATGTYLDLGAATNTSGALRLWDGAGGTNAGLSLASGNMQLYSSGGGGYLTFTTSGSERLRIDSTGNVGIGTTAPTGGLDVANAQTASSGAAYGGIYRQTLTAGANNDSLTALMINPTFADASKTGVTHNGLIVASGNVGIGTTSPGTKLQVDTGAGSTNGFLLTDAGVSALALHINSDKSGSLYAYDGSGNIVGGLYAHYLALNSTGAVGFSSGIAANNSGNDTSISRGAAGKLYVGNGTQGDSSGTLIAGNVGIGTTSSGANLDVVGNIQAATNPTASSLTGLTLYPSVVVASSNNYNARGLNSFPVISVASGATDSGYLAGAYIYAVRNWNTAQVDLGTLATLYGINLSYGNSNYAAGATPTTNTAYGLYIQPANQKGSIGDIYDIYLASLTTGGTNTGSRYSIYQADASSKNYFAGNIGIGTTSPSATLDVRSATVPIQWGDTSLNKIGQLNYSGSWATILAQSGYGLGFGVNGLLNQVVISTAGNVGIGTTNPNGLLHVAGGYLRVERNTGAAILSGMRLYNPSTTDSSGHAIVFSSDTTGTGATTDVDFGQIAFSADVHDHATRTGSIRFLTANANTPGERMRITPAGYVGIGTTSPLTTLHVNGPILAGGTGSETCDAAHVGMKRLNPSTGQLQTCRAMP